MLLLGVTLASFDWIMSLDPHWYSTIFGVYCFAGGGLASSRRGRCSASCLAASGTCSHASITIEHYHDLGKWMFGFTVFWAYIAFSQYLLDLVRQHPGRDHLLPAPL